ncbi:MAG: hypothetical protein MUO76_13155 [Anaerolineaceae bacterium]|nr:hypothetical protein [Anaerolineaceae bacterium]
MAKKLYSGIHNLVIYIFVFAILAAACTNSDVTITPTKAEQETVIESDQTPQVEPTFTASPVAPSVVVLVIPQGINEQLAQHVQVVLAELASASGFSLEVKGSLQVAEITPEWKIVFLLAYEPALSDALVAAPQVQFVVISSMDLGMAPNLSVIREKPEYQTFTAGYLSLLIAPDWRAAGILPLDSPNSILIEETFLNGGHYFCGICNSHYSPVIRFPVVERLSQNSDTGAWQPLIDEMLKDIIYVAYVAPESSNPEMLAYLAEKGLVLLGGETPPDEVRHRWAATVLLDVVSPVRELWPDLLAGQGGKVVDSRVLITDINEEFFSPGRQMFFEQMKEKLESGQIYPFSVPLQ